MRQAVVVSRMRHGSQALDESSTPGGASLAVDWKEALYLATRGGCEALDLQTGQFRVGAPFDAQQSQLSFHLNIRSSRFLTPLKVLLFDPETGNGLGNLDFFQDEHLDTGWTLKETTVEKWWCLGHQGNRAGMWIQGERRM